MWIAHSRELLGGLSPNLRLIASRSAVHVEPSRGRLPAVSFPRRLRSLLGPREELGRLEEDEAGLDKRGLRFSACSSSAKRARSKASIARTASHSVGNWRGVKKASRVTVAQDAYIGKPGRRTTSGTAKRCDSRGNGNGMKMKHLTYTINRENDIFWLLCVCACSEGATSEGTNGIGSALFTSCVGEVE